MNLTELLADVPRAQAPVKTEEPVTGGNLFDDIPRDDLKAQAKPEDKELASAWMTAEEGAPEDDDGSASAFGKYVTDSVSEWGQAMKLGYQESITGMINRGGQLADEDLQNKRLTLMGAFFHGLGQTFDLPYYLAGFAIGSGGANPVTGAAGAMALPTGIKQVYVDRLKKGEVKDARDFAIRSGDALNATTKAWLTGAMGAGVGSMSGKLVELGGKVPAELLTMTAVSSALEGKLPSFEDFTHASMTILAMHAGTAIGKAPGKVSRKALEKMSEKRNKTDLNNLQDALMDHYLKTGELPGEAVLRAQKDQVFAQELLSVQKVNMPKGTKTIGDHIVTPKEVAAKKGTPKEIFKEGISKVITKGVDNLHPLVKYTERLVGGKKNARLLDVIDNPAKVAQLSRGLAGKMSHFYEFGGFDVNTMKTNSRSMKQILKDVNKLKKGKDAQKEFTEYCVAKHATELEARGIKTGLEGTNKKTFTKPLDVKYEKHLLELVELQNSALKQLRDVEIVSEKSYQKMIGQDKYHLPFKRFIPGKGSPFEISAGAAVKSPLKYRKGGTQKIYDPMESIQLDIMGKLQAVENQRIAQSIVKLTKAFDIGGQLIKEGRKSKTLSKEELVEIFDSKDGSGFFASDTGKIAVFQKGKRVSYTIDKEIAELVKTMGTENIGLITKVLSPFASVLRAGATLTLNFAMKNIIRDSVMSYVNTKNSRWMPRFGIDIALEMFKFTKRTDMYKEFLKSGGANSTLVSIDRPSIRKQVSRDIQRTKFHNVISKANPLKVLRDFSEHMEMATRLAEYKLTSKRMKKIGKGEGYRAKAEAGFESREITLDFARTGSKTKSWNKISAFFNATIQGHSKIFRTLTESPAATLKVAMAVVVPSILIALRNVGDEDIKQIPKVQRDMFWVTKLTDDIIIRMPKPHETGIAGSIVERAMEYIIDKDPHAFDDFGSSLVDIMVPNVFPTAALPASEAFFNHSFFRDRKLVSVSNESKLAEYQYTHHTSETAKFAAKMIAKVPGSHIIDTSRSPIGIENYLSAWTGGLGKQTLWGLDQLLVKAGVFNPPVKPAIKWTEYPMVKSFFLRNPSLSAECINEFYENYEAGQRIAKTISGLERELNFDDIPNLMAESDFNNLKSYKEAMDTVHTARNWVLILPKIDGMSNDQLADWKREQIDILINSQIQIAKAGNATFKEIKDFQDQNNEANEIIRRSK